MRKMIRTAFAACAASVILLPSAAVFAQARYPGKTIRLIVPFAPGGPNDILGRLVGQKLTERWGQPVVVENRGGAGGTVGLDAAAKSPGDGYTLAMGGSSNMAVAPSLYRKLAYDPLKDFTPIALVAHVPYALGINPVVPAATVRDLIAIARKKPDYLSYGSSGAGSMSSLAAELLKAMSGANILHVPYKGTAPALTGVISGQIDMMFADLALIKRYADDGKLKILAVTGSKRASTVPDVPTVAESGLKGYLIEPWFGVVAPAGVPGDIVTRINSAIVASLKAPDVLQRLGNLGYEPIGGTADDFAKTIREDIAKYAGVVKKAGISGSL
ncbi:MAG TPA: tripartite tricarboxylate transporter substrate binding protein [Burkholderiales bacterium]|nr:tripartite tricarboxylate transporter substrate binding protein [Burkholderiales bacterium]